MGGKQIESILELIDGNIDLTRKEANQYIKEHQEEILKSLMASGSATVKTSAGNLTLMTSDLERSFA